MNVKMTIQQKSSTRCIFRTVLTDLVGLGGNLHRSKYLGQLFLFHLAHVSVS